MLRVLRLAVLRSDRDTPEFASGVVRVLRVLRVLRSARDTPEFASGFVLVANLSAETSSMQAVSSEMYGWLQELRHYRTN